MVTPRFRVFQEDGCTPGMPAGWYWRDSDPTNPANLGQNVGPFETEQQAVDDLGTLPPAIAPKPGEIAS